MKRGIGQCQVFQVGEIAQLCFEATNLALSTIRKIN